MLCLCTVGSYLRICNINKGNAVQRVLEQIMSNYLQTKQKKMVYAVLQFFSDAHPAVSAMNNSNQYIFLFECYEQNLIDTISEYVVPML